MNPKQKAKELFDKMHNTEHCGIKHFPNKNYCNCTIMNLFQAKQCALIAVQEILNCNPHTNQFNTDVYSTYDYWFQVKQEIEKL